MPTLFPIEDCYVLRNIGCIGANDCFEFTKVDISVDKGIISAIMPSSDSNSNVWEDFILLPTFADIHVHLDKVHTDIRANNVDETRGELHQNRSSL
jgi:cytosine/adenosine deaminase-related metal-dependent hydrolase